MIFLGWVKDGQLSRSRDFGDWLDSVEGLNFGREFQQHRPCLIFLSKASGENLGAVLGTYIGALAVTSDGVMVGEKYLEQLAVTDLFRVEIHAYRFRMTGSIGTNLLVAGILSAPSHIADRSLYYPGDPCEKAFGSPKAAHCKISDFGVSHGFSIEGEKMQLSVEGR